MNESIACPPAGLPGPAAKSALRAALLAARQQCAPDAAADAALARRLAALLHERAPSRIAFYWPTAGEFDARGVVAQWLAQDPRRSAALPVVTVPREPLAFHAWHEGCAMQPGRFGIAVPAEPVAMIPELLLIPCVGFDAARYRLGYGGGYYDRTLAAWPGAAATSGAHAPPRPATIGVAYERGRIAALPREPHDIALDAVVTELREY